MDYVSISGMRRKWDKVELIDMTTDAMEDRAVQITELNKQQMNEGILSTGDNITPDYRPLTVFYKREQGQEYRFVTLRDTGEFQSKMFLSITGDTFTIKSSDDKTGDLMAKYTSDIFGLTSENKRAAWDNIIAPLVVKLIKDMTGAK